MIQYFRKNCCNSYIQRESMNSELDWGHQTGLELLDWTGLESLDWTRLDCTGLTLPVVEMLVWGCTSGAIAFHVQIQWCVLVLYTCRMCAYINVEKINLISSNAAIGRQVYSGTPLKWTPLGPGFLSVIARCPQLRGLGAHVHECTCMQLVSVYQAIHTHRVGSRWQISLQLANI